MQKNLFRFIAAAAVLSLLFLVGCTQQQNNAPPQTASPSSGNPGSSAVSIQSFSFSPSESTIKTGGTITWTNDDSVGHTILSDSGTEIQSGTLNNGQSYSHTFSTAGTYSYHCSIHPAMKGKIIVQ